MTDALLYCLLGLSSGAVYALFAAGIVVVHKGTGVISFAQGAMATLSAYIFLTVRDDLRWGTGTAVALALIFSVALGIGVSSVMGLLRGAPQLAKLVGSLGVLLSLEAAAVLIWGSDVRTTAAIFPTSRVQVLGASVGADRLLLAACAVAISIALVIVNRYSRLGVIAEAMTDNEDEAALRGLSPAIVGTAAWVTGSVLACAAGILTVPLTSLSGSGFTVYVVPALGAALLARFRSVGVAAAAGLGIGMLQSLIVGYVSTPGATDAVPFIIIIAAVVLAGKRLPERFHLLTARLPEVTPGRLHPVPAAAATAAAIAALFAFDRSITTALTTAIVSGVLLLSVVLITGYLGQISLAQLAFAGVGGFVCARLSSHVSLPLALLGGAAAAMIVGIVIGLPALWVRGPNLAIVTLGLAVVMESLVFGSDWFGGGQYGRRVANPTVFGLDLDPYFHPTRFGIFALLVLWIALAIVIAVRRSTLGHHMLAVRYNERAAAATGIDVVRTKLFGFAVSALLAGLSGGVLAYQFGALSADRFAALDVIPLVAFSYIAGVGSILGAVIAGLLTTGSLVPTLVDRWTGGSNWIPLIGGLALLQMVATNPDGLVPFIAHRWTALRERTRPQPHARTTPPSSTQSRRRHREHPKVAPQRTRRRAASLVTTNNARCQHRPRSRRHRSMLVLRRKRQRRWQRGVENRGRLHRRRRRRQPSRTQERRRSSR